MHSLKYDPYGRNRIQILIMYFCSMYENYISLFMILQGLPETCEYLKVVRIMGIFQSCIYKWVILHWFKLEAVDCLGGWGRTIEAMLRSITFALREPKAQQLAGAVSSVWLPLSPTCPCLSQGISSASALVPCFFSRRFFRMLNVFERILNLFLCLWSRWHFSVSYDLIDDKLCCEIIC